MDAVELAATVFRDNPPMRIDGRDLTYFMVAATLLKKDPSQNERLRALLFLETELYPEGRRDGLVKGLTGAEPARRRVRRRGGDPLAHFQRDFMIVHVINVVQQTVRA